MENNGQEYKRKKVNAVGFAFLLITMAVSAYAVFSPKFELSALESELSKNVKEIRKGDEEMLNDPSYIRLNEYGRGLSAASAFLRYKDANPTWFQFLGEVARSVPKDVTLRQFQYEPAKRQVFVSMLAPERSRIVQAMSELEDSEGLERVDFDSITEEKLTFPGEKTQRTAYVAVARFSVDEEYLKGKYEFANEVREQRSESAKDEPQAANVAESGS